MEASAWQSHGKPGVDARAPGEALVLAEDVDRSMSEPEGRDCRVADAPV